MDKLEKALEKARQQRGTKAAPPRQEAQEPLRAFQQETAAGEASAFPVSGMTSLLEENLESNRIVAHHTRSAEADIYRLLRTQVLQVMNKSNWRTLAITSPNYGDGKTTTAINLAVSIALDLNQTVLLADLDLRKPNIHTYLGLDVDYGLTNYLTSQAALSECLYRLPFERLSVLPAGHIVDHSSEVLGSPQMGRLAQEMRERYPDRLIIYDMPPLLEQDDPLAFLPHVDAVLLVVQDGVTRTDEVKRSLDILSSANVIGTILNNA